MIAPVQNIYGKQPSSSGKLRAVKRLIAQLLPFLILTTRFAFPCSVASLQLRQVSPNMTVKVTHLGKPIAGIEVEVVPQADGADPVFFAVTDEDGAAQIAGLVVGRYYLIASHRGFEGGREWIEVVSRADAKTIQHFDFQWADYAYVTRRAAGWLVGFVPGDTGNKIMDLARPKSTVYPGVGITLTGAFSDAEYHTLSDATGSFDIGPVPDGIYVLAIDGGMSSIYGTAEKTRQVVELTQSASRSSLRLVLSPGVTGCYGVGFELDEQ